MQFNRNVELSTPSERAAFASRLRMLREGAGYESARAFAAAASIDPKHYSRYERGEVEPTLSVLRKVCESLGVTPNDLLAFDKTAELRPSGRSETV